MEARCSSIIMLIATAIFLQLILAYTAWVYNVLWARSAKPLCARSVRWPTETLEIAAMWYFAWILGLGLATTVGIPNALCYELRVVRAHPAKRTEHLDTP